MARRRRYSFLLSLGERVSGSRRTGEGADEILGAERDSSLRSE